MSTSFGLRAATDVPWQEDAPNGEGATGKVNSARAAGSIADRGLGMTEGLWMTGARTPDRG